MDAPAKAAARILTVDDLPDRYRKLYYFMLELAEHEGVPTAAAEILSLAWVRHAMVEIARCALAAR